MPHNTIFQQMPLLFLVFGSRYRYYIYQSHKRYKQSSNQRLQVSAETKEKQHQFPIQLHNLQYPQKKDSEPNFEIELGMRISENKKTKGKQKV